MSEELARALRRLEAEIERTPFETVEKSETSEGPPAERRGRKRVRSVIRDAVGRIVQVVEACDDGSKVVKHVERDGDNRIAAIEEIHIPAPEPKCDADVERLRRRVARDRARARAGR